MYSVIIPVVVLFVLIMVKKIPYIGGKVTVALIVASLLTLILAHVYSPVEWLFAWINGLDRLSWVMALALVGSWYGETQGAIGALDTVVDLFRAILGKSARGMIVAVIIAITVGGEAFGDAIGAAAVIGMMVIPALAGMGMTAEKIAATITMSVLMGSIIPPISQAVMLSASILGIDQAASDQAINLSFITCGIGMLICMSYAAFFFVEKRPLDEHLIPKDTAGQIIKKGWVALMPLFLIALLIILNSFFKINVMKIILGPVYTWASGVKIIRGFTNTIVMILFAATIVTLVSKIVRENCGKIIADGFKNVTSSLSVQACAAFFVGSILAGGQIDTVIEFTKNLNETAVKLGGGFSVALMGMLTGSQTSAQNLMFTFLGPVLLDMGVTPSHAAIVGSHLASAGQGLPPANVTALVVAAMVGANLKTNCDPVKTMVYLIPMCAWLFFCGILFMFI